MTYNECLERLREGAYTLNEDGLAIRIKPVPETDRKGAVDPRALAGEKNAKPYPLPADSAHPTMEEIIAIRNWMGCENQDLSHGITTQEKVVKTAYGDVPVRIYSPEPGRRNAIVVYIHGGAFYGGTLRVIENACKLVADKSEAVVISVDYGLAPEHKFPQGLMQCYEIVKWAHENAGDLGGSADKLVVMGDSAGGNLATACCLLDKERRIKFQVLLYPTVVQTQAHYDGWDESRYDILEEE